jgi:tetratricopeptide (TPR) repeat protein
MRLLSLLFILVFCGAIAVSQQSSNGEYSLALPDHEGKLEWSADGFQVIQSSAKANGREIGLRGQDRTGRLMFLGFLFLVPEEAPVTSGKCRDGILNQEEKTTPGLKILESSEIVTRGRLPVSLVTYVSPRGGGAVEYAVRGFAATRDTCGDLAFYSSNPISAQDADLARIFSSYELNADYVPKFADAFLYAEVLYDSQMYKAAAPIFEKSLAMLSRDGAPFPSTLVAKRVATDQAGLAYGVAGDLTKARAMFEKGIAEDPNYPMFYYNLACTDAGEKKLIEARTHLQQAFERKANLNAGEKMPDPTKEDSFLPYRRDKEFWNFLERLEAGN